MPRPQIVIENPILNAPYEEPRRHFRFDDEGITDDVVEGRRASTYFIPIPKAKKKGGQLVFDEWTGDRIKENLLIDQIRERVARWREIGWPAVTPTTRALLEHWTNPERDRRLFFCQIEALETAIYLTEAAKKLGDAWIETELRTYAEDANPGLFRLAHKMATGTGKTVVMAMLIAWHTLNKAANPKDGRFGDAFLVVAPGITIRDRLRVLLPSDPQNSASSTSSRPTGSGTSVGPRSSSRTSTPSSCGRRSRLRSSPRSWRGSDRVCSPRRPTRWSGGSPASSAPSATSSCSTTKPTTATGDGSAPTTPASTR